jgi:hypothetical protein
MSAIWSAAVQLAVINEVLPRNLSSSFSKVWVYSPDVKALQDQQKLELKALQAAEQANGKAHQERGEGRITVAIKEG